MAKKKEDSVPVVGLVDVGDEKEWKEPPIVTFGQRASLQIARWVLMIFAGVYLLCFGIAFGMLFMEGATFESALELVKFMLTAILPLVTLAVGYYLGDKGNQDA